MSCDPIKRPVLSPATIAALTDALAAADLRLSSWRIAQPKKKPAKRPSIDERIRQARHAARNAGQLRRSA